jgi:hypothetical protein
VLIAPDDGEEKMVFLAKVGAAADPRPRFVYYLTAISKTFQAIFKQGTPKFSEELLYSANLNTS